ncbi:hypothetical protein SISSUDRAFT_1133021 [Sistotremastrum suecicum HHB10207 ss-3]|uniref:3'-5' exonuclease n=1 Tax=Sistotremastrum suecicum HHB10207 ss-3 TaxID=1314776 RepID=A0A165XYK3_9AGAM|nr:hypothetical protein SISSUDRAFT_1133021 [Sistotremastrum suecicum HHB10207 ss-3]
MASFNDDPDVYELSDHYDEDEINALEDTENLFDMATSAENQQKNQNTNNSGENMIVDTAADQNIAADVPDPSINIARLSALKDAVSSSQNRPFFCHQYLEEEEEEDTDVIDEDIFDDPDLTFSDQSKGDENKAWFRQPKKMPDWLYLYFRDTIRPMIQKRADGKAGTGLLRPPGYANAPYSFWVIPTDPAHYLYKGKLAPDILWRPRVFLWLPHFLVNKLHCPSCLTKTLEKNGPIPPRRITDIDDSFYVVTWQYYCRNGCKKCFNGWNPRLLNSLPRFIQLSFPAVLSRKGGLSHQVMTQLRVGNQHKMGPSGVRSLLFEMHTLRFNRIQLQYLESLFHIIRSAEMEDPKQPILPLFQRFHQFGDFADPKRYSGFVPTETYLSMMLNHEIEKDEEIANQHTSCLPPDHLAIDDSHKINKHIAKMDGIPIFGALWTCMNARYIRAQALTLTKSHDERYGSLIGIAQSAKEYGFEDPIIVFSDDPIKDKQLLHTAFPSLASGVVPPIASRGLDILKLPEQTEIHILNTLTLIDTRISALLLPLDEDPVASLCVSIDAEWNISRKIGVSLLQIAPHSMPNHIYIIPLHKFPQLSPALIRLFTNPRVFKVGSAVKGDFKRLRKQFAELSNHTTSTFNLIELKAYAIRCGIIARHESGALHMLAEKLLKKYLPKDDTLRKTDDWEHPNLSEDLKNYAALDVFASRLLFEKMSTMLPFMRVNPETPGGTRVAVLVQGGGDVAAYGVISPTQPAFVGDVRVSQPNNQRVVVDVHEVVRPSAAAVLHLSRTQHSRTSSGALTFGDLKRQAGSLPFQMVTPLSMLEFDIRDSNTSQDLTSSGHSTHPSPNPLISQPVTSVDPIPEDNIVEQESDANQQLFEDIDSMTLIEDLAAMDVNEEEHADLLALALQSQAIVDPDQGNNSFSVDSDILKNLERLVNAPPDENEIQTRIKKDLFHAFHMLPLPIHHALRGLFLGYLRDHLMRWDPAVRKSVDAICREKFKRSFDQMLLHNPRFIAARTPRYVPPPSVLVPALNYVFDTFGPALDAKTKQPLFSALAWKKAKAIVELARDGYLSDNQGVQLYEKMGVDQYGLQLYRCLRGTNKVEGGPHGDIYRKFGALHAGPRLTVNCLTDHRTWYNTQAFAKHFWNVDWNYHHSLSMTNRTSFLLNYLSDIVEGAQSYADWVNGDLYTKSKEKFGIVPFPESLRLRYCMDPFGPAAAKKFKLRPNDDWLRQRQQLALPVLPPITIAARKLFFKNVADFAAPSSQSQKGSINFERFTIWWNSTASKQASPDIFYVTPEVLAAYAKSWEKSNITAASKDLMSEKLTHLDESRSILAAQNAPFPSFITGSATLQQPEKGVLDLSTSVVPISISTSLAASAPIFPTPLLGMSTISSPIGSVPPPSNSPFNPHSHEQLQFPVIPPPPSPPQFLGNSDNSDAMDIDPILVSETMHMNSSTEPQASTSASVPTMSRRRQRLVPDGLRQREQRACRRCKTKGCIGSSDIMKCPQPCTNPCTICGQTMNCKGVDGGNMCSVTQTRITKRK